MWSFRSGWQGTAAIFWMKTRGGWLEAPQTHEVSMKTAAEMTDAKLEARIRELDRQVRPMLDLKPVTQLRGA